MKELRVGRGQCVQLKHITCTSIESLLTFAVMARDEVSITGQMTGLGGGGVFTGIK